MALKKEITSEDGITLTYHRIVRLSCDVNVMNSITVQSYISQDNRYTEKTAGENKEKAAVFVRVSVYAADYNEDMTVRDAYGYLKTLEEFEGAEDV